MKKNFIVFAAVFICLLTLSACEKGNPYEKFVSEARTEIYSGTSENYDISAYYGSREQPALNDGEIGEKIYVLSLRVNNGGIDQVKRTVTLEYERETYSGELKLNLVTGVYGTEIEIKNFSPKEFTVTVSSGSDKEEVLLSSDIPENTIDYRTALNCLTEKQAELLTIYKDAQGNFNGEIRLKLLVKSGKPYWYVSLCAKSGKIRALLLDGFTGEPLAVREIF